MRRATPMSAPSEKNKMPLQTVTPEASEEFEPSEEALFEEEAREGEETDLHHSNESADENQAGIFHEEILNNEAFPTFREEDKRAIKSMDATQLYLNEIGFSPLLSAEEECFYSRFSPQIIPKQFDCIAQRINYAQTVNARMPIACPRHQPRNTRPFPIRA